MIEETPAAFILTWKSKVLPHAEIVKFVDQQKSGNRVRFFWRCANRGAKPDNLFYVLSQDINFRGIFAAGRIIREPRKMDDTIPNTQSYRAEIEFSRIVDPYKEMLVDYDDLVNIFPTDEEKHHPLYRPQHWATRQSGQRIKPYAAREINRLIFGAEQSMYSNEFNEQYFNPKIIDDTKERIFSEIAIRRGQKMFREKLLRAYGYQCAVTGCKVLDILEAAHIFPYYGDKTDHIQNGLVLRSDIHTLFDCGLLTIDANNMSIVMSNRVSDPYYRSMAGKIINLPDNVALRPSIYALNYHRHRCAIKTDEPE